MTSVKRQRGVILIVAMFVVVLVTALIVSVSWKFTLHMARYESRWHGAVGQAYLEGAEELAKKVLIEDAAQGETDHPAEDWATTDMTAPTDEGWVRAKLEDAQGRFNLNLLLERREITQEERKQAGFNPALPENKYTSSQRRFIRLLQALPLEEPLDQSQAIEITEAVMDWLDTDSNPTGFGGAEQNYYDDLEIPYPISNGPMTSVSELALVKGITPQMFVMMKPFLIVLGPTIPININSMRGEMMVMFNEKNDLTPLEPEDAAELIKLRNERLFPGRDDPDASTDPALQQEGQGYANPKEFGEDNEVFQRLGLTGENAIDENGLSAKANFLIVVAETMVGEQTRRGLSLLYRERNQVLVARRTEQNF